MRGWHGIALSVLAVIIAFQLGYSRGVRDCPARAEVSAARRAAVERDIALALSAPSGRDAICDQVFELIEWELGREVIDEQAARARRTNPPSE